MKVDINCLPKLRKKSLPLVFVFSIFWADDMMLPQNLFVFINTYSLHYMVERKSYFLGLIRLLMKSEVKINIECILVTLSSMVTWLRSRENLGN